MSLDDNKRLDPVMEKTSCEDKFELFLSELKEAIDIYLPEKTVTIHQNDRLWMMKELKFVIIEKDKMHLSNMVKILDRTRNGGTKSSKKPKPLKLFIMNTR